MTNYEPKYDSSSQFDCFITRRYRNDYYIDSKNIRGTNHSVIQAIYSPSGFGGLIIFEGDTIRAAKSCCVKHEKKMEACRIADEYTNNLPLGDGEIVCV